MSDTNPAQAASAALVAAIQAAIDAALSPLPNGTVSVIDGWPDAMAGIPGGSFVVVTTGDMSQEANAPIPFSSTTVDGVITQLYDVATWLMNAQVDVFTDFKDQRDDLVPLIRPIFSNVPWSGNAQLTLSGYYGVKMRVEVTGESDDDPKGPIQGRWRHTFEIRTKGDIIAPAEWIAIQRFDLDINGTVTTVE